MLATIYSTLIAIQTFLSWYIKIVSMSDWEDNKDSASILQGWGGVSARSERSFTAYTWKWQREHIAYVVIRALKRGINISTLSPTNLNPLQPDGFSHWLDPEWTRWRSLNVGIRTCFLKYFKWNTSTHALQCKSYRGWAVVQTKQRNAYSSLVCTKSSIQTGLPWIFSSCISI